MARGAACIARYDAEGHAGILRRIRRLKWSRKWTQSLHFHPIELNSALFLYLIRCIRPLAGRHGAAVTDRRAPGRMCDNLAIRDHKRCQIALIKLVLARRKRSVISVGSLGPREQWHPAAPNTAISGCTSNTSAEQTHYSRSSVVATCIMFLNLLCHPHRRKHQRSRVCSDH